MKNRDFSWIWAALAFWPWAIGIFDLAVWSVLGHQLTDIHWEENRGMVLLLWPVVCLATASFVV